MSGHDGFRWLHAMEARMLRVRVEALEAGGWTYRATTAELRAVAVEKLAQKVALTREEVAAWLDVSSKFVQRMDAAGRLPRCPGLGTVVRYASSDVLRLASASGKER